MATTNFLIIGSAHIDTVAITEEELSDGRPDVEGRVSFGLGGTAFNIAKNLAQNSHKVELLTSLKQHSITADLVAQQCHKHGIKITPIYQQESEGGFAAHYKGANIFKAICEAAIERVTLSSFKESLDSTIKKGSTIVVDTNLQAQQLEEVLFKSYTMKLPVLVAGVSVSRVKRIQQAVDGVKNNRTRIQKRVNHLIDVLSINLREAEALGIIINCTRNAFIDRPEEHISIQTVDNLSVRRLVVSCDTDGYYIFDFSQHGQVPCTHKNINISPVEVISDNGAGDALIAAIAASHSEDFDIWENNIQRYVAPVLKVVSATTGNEFGFSRSTDQQTQWSIWSLLSIALFSLAIIPTAGNMQPIFGIIQGRDLAFTIAIVLGLSAGGAGGKARDLAVKLGLIESRHYVSIGSAILPALSGLITLFAFFALPHYANGSSSAQFSAPTHMTATLWFCVALIGGWFADLVISQRIQLKLLKKLVRADYET